ncbi:MAG: FMN-binding protein [Anaerolineaceae bacterium]|nr:FMN-binding protein [Anaerolineaceae bacterium]
MKQAIRFVIVLGSICLIMGSGVAVIYGAFKDKIARKEQLQFESLLLQVLPTGQGFSAPERLPNAADVFAVKDSAGRPAGYAAEGAAQGYSSKVRVLVGVTADQEPAIRKVVVVFQQETPGLGANVSETRSKWSLWEKIGHELGLSGQGETEQRYNKFLDQFEGKTIGRLDEVDAMTAATITSNAVKTSVSLAVERIRQATQAAQATTQAPPSTPASGGE